MRDAARVVDLEPFRTGSSSGREATAAAARRACEEIGLLVLRIMLGQVLERGGDGCPEQAIRLA